MVVLQLMLACYVGHEQFFCILLTGAGTNLTVSGYV